MGTTCKRSAEGGEASPRPVDAVLSQVPAPAVGPRREPRFPPPSLLSHWVAGDKGSWHTNSKPPTWEGRAWLQP